VTENATIGGRGEEEVEDNLTELNAVTDEAVVGIQDLLLELSKIAATRRLGLELVFNEHFASGVPVKVRNRNVLLDVRVSSGLCTTGDGPD
jgi:hypothetical protein